MNAYDRAMGLIEELDELEETRRWMRNSERWLSQNRLQEDLSDVTIELYKHWNAKETLEKPLHPKSQEWGEKIYQWYRDKYPRRRKVTVERCFEEDDFEDWLEPYRDVAGQMVDDVEDRQKEIKQQVAELAPVAVKYIDQEESDPVKVESVKYSKFDSGRYSVRVDLRVHEIERFGIDIEAKKDNPGQYRGISRRTLYANCTEKEAKIIKRLPKLDDEEFLQWCSDYEKRVDPIKYRHHIKHDLTEEDLEELGLPTTNVGYRCIRCGSKPVEMCQEPVEGYGDRDDVVCGAPLCDNHEHGHHCSGRDRYNWL